MVKTRNPRSKQSSTSVHDIPAAGKSKVSSSQRAKKMACKRAPLNMECLKEMDIVEGKIGTFQFAPPRVSYCPKGKRARRARFTSTDEDEEAEPSLASLKDQLDRIERQIVLMRNALNEYFAQTRLMRNDLNVYFAHMGLSQLPRNGN